MHRCGTHRQPSACVLGMYSWQPRYRRCSEMPVMQLMAVGDEALLRPGFRRTPSTRPAIPVELAAASSSSHRVDATAPAGRLTDPYPWRRASWLRTRTPPELGRGLRIVRQEVLQPSRPADDQLLPQPVRLALPLLFQQCRRAVESVRRAQLPARVTASQQSHEPRARALPGRSSTTLGGRRRRGRETRRPGPVRGTRLDSGVRSARSAVGMGAWAATARHAAGRPVAMPAQHRLGRLQQP